MYQTNKNVQVVNVAILDSMDYLITELRKEPMNAD